MRRPSTALLSAAAYAAMFGFGLAVALLGAILPVISAQLRFDLARAGGLFLAMNFAMLLTQLGVGPLMDRFGHKPPLAAGPLLVSAALLLIAGAAGFAALVGAVVLLGVGSGLLNSASNTLVADLHSDPARKGAALNVLGIFFGLGAISLPFTIGALLEWLGLAAILRTAAIVVLAPALCLFLAFPAPKHGQGMPLGEALRLARNPAVLLFAALLFFESGNEFIVAGFTSSYLTRELHSSVRVASYFLALYWAAVIVTRLVLARMLLKVDGPRTVMASAAAAAAGLGVLALAQTEIAAAGAMLLIGCGLSGIFPTVLGQAGGEFAEYSGTVFGILFAGALTGGMSLPWALGQAAAGWSFRGALLLPVAGFLAIAVLQAAIARRRRGP